MTQHIKETKCDDMFRRTGDERLEHLSDRMKALTHWHGQHSANELRDLLQRDLEKFLAKSADKTSALTKKVEFILDEISGEFDVHDMMADIEHLHTLADIVPAEDMTEMASYLKPLASLFDNVDCNDKSMTSLMVNTFRVAGQLSSTDFKDKFDCLIGEEGTTRDNHELITFCHNMQNLEQYGDLVAAPVVHDEV